MRHRHHAAAMSSARTLMIVALKRKNSVLERKLTEALTREIELRRERNRLFDTLTAMRKLLK